MCGCRGGSLAIFRSQIAACEIAARGMADLVGRYGAEGVGTLMVAMMDYSERLTRQCLLELPDGEATFTDWIDDDQIDIGRADSAGLHDPQAWRHDGGGLDRQRAAGEGRDQQYT